MNRKKRRANEHAPRITMSKLRRQQKQAAARRREQQEWRLMIGRTESDTPIAHAMRAAVSRRAS